MNFIKKTIVVFSLFIFHQNLTAQVNSVPAISKDYFMNPLDIKLYLAVILGR